MVGCAMDTHVPRWVRTRWVQVVPLARAVSVAVVVPDGTVWLAWRVPGEALARVAAGPGAGVAVQDRHAPTCWRARRRTTVWAIHAVVEPDVVEVRCGTAPGPAKASSAAVTVSLSELPDRCSPPRRGTAPRPPVRGPRAPWRVPAGRGSA